MFAGNRVIKSFVLRIREKLCKIDLEGNLDVDQAAHALAGGDHVDVSRDQNAVMQRFESEVYVNLRAGLHSDYGVAEPFGYNNVERALAHLARPMEKIEHRDGEGGGGEV
jgi:hypothetical protein